MPRPRSPSGKRWAGIAGEKRRGLLMKLIERHDGRCAHCGRKCVKADSPAQDKATATIDHHPVPRSELPKSEWLNPSRAVLSCGGCNQAKNEEMIGAAHAY